MEPSGGAKARRVVMVDADNPLLEVRGEFFWREDRDALLADARRAAFQEGYRAGWEAADGRHQHQNLRFTVSRRRHGGLLRRLIPIAPLGIGLVVVLTTIAEQLVANR